MSCSAIPKINRYLQRLVNVVSGLKLDGCCKTSRRLYFCSLLRLAFIAVFISAATIEPLLSFDILSLASYIGRQIIHQVMEMLINNLCSRVARSGLLVGYALMH